MITSGTNYILLILQEIIIKGDDLHAMSSLVQVNGDKIIIEQQQKI